MTEPCRLTKRHEEALAAIRSFNAVAGEGASIAWLARKLRCSRTYAYQIARVLFEAKRLRSPGPPLTPVE